MGTQHFHIHFIMNAFLTSVLFSASVLLAQECPEMPPMECADGDILCPMGADEFGCAYPDVCMPSGSVCPGGAVLCYMGEDDNGCPLPDTCMPDGAACPVVCPNNPPMECADGDIICPMGADDNGCSYPEVCMPSGSACPEF